MSLLDRFDTLLFDLDGVVYVGTDGVEHADAVINAAHAHGVRCMYVTNNAARTADSVASHLRELGIDAAVSDVVTSPQAAASLLPQYVPDGARILVIGGAGIDAVLLERGYVPVRSLDDQPAAVMQGYSPDLSWRDLAEASFAVRAGLPWIATNPDLTFPTARGIAPGNGSLVEVVARTVGRPPDAVAGKPEPPLLHEAVSRSQAERPLMIGDRLDTDIEAGARVGIPTLLVMTGVSSLEELLAARPHERPDFIGEDLRVLLADYPDVTWQHDIAHCRHAWARVTSGVLECGADGPVNDPWDVVRAGAVASWKAEAGSVDPAASAGVLRQSIAIRYEESGR